MDNNGRANMGSGEGVISDILQDEVSLGYRPQIPLEGMWGAGDAPQITLRRDIELMQYHPVVTAALDYYKSGIAGAEFWGGPKHDDPEDEKGRPISPDDRVSQFVMAHVERFWQRGVPVMQEGGYVYGWAPGEHIYKEASGMLVWSHVKGFHPNDSFVLTYFNRPVGVRVKSIREAVGDPEHRGGEVDLWFASDRVPAKAAWYPHRPRFQQLYGRTQFGGAWRPWRRLAWRDGVEQVIDAAIYRAGYAGPTVKHPKEDAQTAQSGIPATRLDGASHPRRSARDVARQMIEWSKAGAGFTISSENYPQAQGGGPKWEVIWPEHVMDVSPLINAAGYLEDQIMLGMGVPPELVKAGGTGSGYSGRSIPREAFLDAQQKIADAMLQLFVEQVIRPLVLWNFGDVPFNIQAKPLLKSQTANKQGEPKPPLPQPGADEQQPPGQPPSVQPPRPAQDGTGLALSIDSTSRVMEVVRRVLTSPRIPERIILSTDAGGREHKGKGKGGGQFTKKSSQDEIERPEWDGVIRPEHMGRRRSGQDVATWDFYDDEGNRFPQEVSIEERDYDTDPDGDDPDSIITIYRWVSGDDSGTTDQGEWTTDEQEAYDDGEEYARDNDQDEPEEDDTERAQVLDQYLDGDEDNAKYVVGAPDDATVSVEVDEDDFSIEVSIRHPDISNCRRTLDTDKHGNKFIYNDILKIRRDKQGGGFASALFSRQASQAAESGYAYIETHAAGSWDRRRDWNGYYTWPCLGYDQSLDDLAAQDRAGRECVNKIAEILPDAESVLDVVQAGELELDDVEAQDIRTKLAQLDKELGRATRDRTKITGLMWWQVHGEGMEHAKFDLKEGSRSWEQNEAYRQSKKK